MLVATPTPVVVSPSAMPAPARVPTGPATGATPKLDDAPVAPAGGQAADGAMLVRTGMGGPHLPGGVLEPVATDGAQGALAATPNSRAELTASLLALSNQRAAEATAKLPPLTRLPAVITDCPIATGSEFYSDYETFVEPGAARQVSGTDDAIRMARRVSIQRDGQVVGVFDAGGGSKYIAPLEYRKGSVPTKQRENSHHDDRVGPPSWGKRSALKEVHHDALERFGDELEVAIGPKSFNDRRQHKKTWVEGYQQVSETVSPFHSPQTILDRFDKLDKIRDDATPAIEDSARELAQARSKLQHANLFNRRSRTERVTQLETQLAQQEATLKTSLDEFNKLLDTASGTMLSEQEEWIAAATKKSGMRDLKPVPAGVDYAGALQRARDEVLYDTERSKAILEGIDGRLWTATVNLPLADPDILSLTTSVRAVTGGGRTNVRTDPAM